MTTLIDEETERMNAALGDPPRRTHDPTPEQAEIIAAFELGDDLVIEAGAGSGKTSTLRMLAATKPQARGIYIAYNRAIAEDAKASFPSSVNCATAHSFAFRAEGRRFASRLGGPRLPSREVARILSIEPIRFSAESMMSSAHIARLVMDTVANFCHSAETQIKSRHVPRPNGMDQPEFDMIRPTVLTLANRAWADLSKERGRLKFEHDHYLKIWQLSNPILDCDYVLLDEAQDANPVIADVIEHQSHAQRILVGDRSQAIYGWRGAVDAMENFDGQRLTLSQSFRFGQAIADEANKWLTVLDAPLRLRGFEALNSRVDTLQSPRAILCRTNAGAVGQAMLAIKDGRQAALVGGGGDIKRLAEAALSLKQGRGTDHPELFMFRDWDEVVEYVQEDESGADLKVFVKMIDSMGAQMVIRTINDLVDERQADVIISTAHKAKGREWSTVKIATDFPTPKKGEINRAEAMLAYVAVTRAKEVLDNDGLRWIDAFVGAPTPVAINQFSPCPDCQHFIKAHTDGRCALCSCGAA